MPALQGKRSAIDVYLQQIQESVKTIVDSSLLDHIIAKLLPVVTTLHAHLDSPLKQEDQLREDFGVTEKFAPAQKNERQLSFDKVKSKTKKTKVILK